MQRDLKALSGKAYDVLVIGGGVYGAWIAYDSALRGFSVALVDKQDFGSATSSNSLKIIHGGLRYLQHGDIRRMRTSIRERNVLMRIAPHLVHPLPFLLPTYRNFAQSKHVMSLAFAMNRLLGSNGKRSSAPQKQLPPGKIVSREECLQWLPGMDTGRLTGGALWYECQVHNTERMILSILRSAHEAGADLANYVAMTGSIKNGSRITGVILRDVLSGEEFQVKAKVFVNASGPWVSNVVALFSDSSGGRKVPLSKAINLVVKRQLVTRGAVGITSKTSLRDHDAFIRTGKRLLVLTPWNSHTVIGTAHSPFSRSPEDLDVTEEEIGGFIQEINRAYPPASLKREEVTFIHRGLLPMNGNHGSTANVSLLKKHKVYDHAKTDGSDGLISVVGVKLTEARYVAEKVTDYLAKKLQKMTPRSNTAERPIHGGHIGQFDKFIEEEGRRCKTPLGPKLTRRLLCNYGSAYSEVIKHTEKDSSLCQSVGDTSPVTKAEVLHGVRQEMAVKLADVVMRRTALGTAGHPGKASIKTCATIMAKELNWNERRVQKEIEDVDTLFSARS